jgi:hypothetical protein
MLTTHNFKTLMLLQQLHTKNYKICNVLSTGDKQVAEKLFSFLKKGMIFAMLLNWI